MLRNRLVAITAVAFWCAALAPALAAQRADAAAAATSQATGVVNDPIGAPVAGAVVTLEDAGETLWIVLSDAHGRYLVDQLRAGEYTMTVTSPGFKEFTAPVAVRPGQKTSVPVTLKIAFSESIEVRQSLSDPRRNPSNVILSSRDVELLPADETLFLERLAQLSGATRAEDLTIFVDGFREYKRVPPKGTIDVIRINSNPFSAEYAGSTARRIEITTKPGADAFHGSARLEIRDSMLNARAPMEPELAPMRYRNINGYLQGPISKGRAGFLLYGGIWEQDENAVIRSTVLDPVTRVAEPFELSVAAPLRQTSLVAKVDFKVFNQRMNALFMRNTGRHRNRGLESGFVLPEHAFGTDTTNDVGRLWWASVGTRSINDVRIQFTRDVVASTPLGSDPSVVVLNAFTAGGNQDASGSRETTSLQASDTFMFQAGRHLFKSGVQLDLGRRDSTDRAGFGGTFTFGAGVDRISGAVISPIESYRRTLLGIPGYGPSQFAIARGNPHVSTSNWQVGAFLLDDWTISPSLSLSLGVRQEAQSSVSNGLALAPRAYLSWVVDPAGRTVLRAGTGVFYTAVDPDLVFQVRKLDGTHQEYLTVSNPAFFPAVPAPGSLPGSVTRTIYSTAGDLRTPRTIRTSASVEQRLPANLWAVLGYTYDQGRGLLRSRILTAPAVFQIESTGRSAEQAMQMAIRGNVGRSTFYVNYTLAKREGDTDGAWTVQSAQDPADDYGALATDRRHEVTAGASLVLPRDVYVSPSVTVMSGRPFNITTGQDGNGDTVFADRPAFAQAGDPAAIATPYGLLTPTPAPGATIVPRNFGRDPGQTNFNLSVAKIFKNGLAFNADIENVLNLNRLTGSSGVLTSAVFGTPNRSLSGRRITMGVRFDF
jgi:hypothetical protein